MGQLVTVTLILFFVMISLGFGTDICDNQLSQYTSQEYNGLITGITPVDFIINQISNNIGVFIGAFGGGILLTLFGMNISWAISIFILQIIINIFLLPIDCIKSALVIEPLSTIFIIFFNMSIIYVVISLIQNKEM